MVTILIQVIGNTVCNFIKKEEEEKVLEEKNILDEQGFAVVFV